MASNIFGKLPQNFTHKRQSAQRLKIRSTSERKSFSSKYLLSVGSEAGTLLTMLLLLTSLSFFGLFLHLIVGGCEGLTSLKYRPFFLGLGLSPKLYVSPLTFCSYVRLNG